MVDLKAVYQAVTEDAAMQNIEVFDKRWGKKYPRIAISWRENWPELSAYFKYPQAVRTLIYTTNAIEGYNRQLRKVTKNRGSFPSDTALFKIVTANDKMQEKGG